MAAAQSRRQQPSIHRINMPAFLIPWPTAAASRLRRISLLWCGGNCQEGKRRDSGSSGGGEWSWNIDGFSQAVIVCSRRCAALIVLGPCFYVPRPQSTSRPRCPFRLPAIRGEHSRLNESLTILKPMRFCCLREKPLFFL